MIADIMYMPKNGGIMVAEGTDSFGEKFKSYPFAEYLITSAQDPTCIDYTPTDPFSEPNSNAFVDLDGDCMPDIFL